MSKKPCRKCVIDVATGLYLKICRDALSKETDCNKITEQFQKGEISVDQLVNQIKTAARNEPDVLADLEEIDRVRKTGKFEPE